MSFTFSADGSAKAADPDGTSHEYTYSVRASGSALLEPNDELGHSWRGVPQDTITARFIWKDAYKTCTYTNEFIY